MATERSCNYCGGPMPESAAKQAKYCSVECKKGQQEKVRTEKREKRKKRQENRQKIGAVQAVEVRDDGLEIMPPKEPQLQAEDLPPVQPEPTPSEPFPIEEQARTYKALLEKWVPNQTLIEIRRWSAPRDAFDDWMGDPNDEKWKPIEPKSVVRHKKSWDRLRFDISKIYPTGGWFQIRFFRDGINGPESMSRPLYCEIEANLDQEGLSDMLSLYENTIAQANEEKSELQKQVEEQRSENNSFAKQMLDMFRDDRDSARTEASTMRQANQDWQNKLLDMAMSRANESDDDDRWEQMMQTQNSQMYSLASMFNRPQNNNSNELIVAMMQQQSQQSQQMMQMFMAMMQSQNQQKSSMADMMPLILAIINKDSGGLTMKDILPLISQQQQANSPLEMIQQMAAMQNLFNKPDDFQKLLQQTMQKQMIESITGGGTKDKDEPDMLDRGLDALDRIGVSGLIKSKINPSGSGAQSEEKKDWTTGLRSPDVSAPSDHATVDISSDSIQAPPHQIAFNQSFIPLPEQTLTPPAPELPPQEQAAPPPPSSFAPQAPEAPFEPPPLALLGEPFEKLIADLQGAYSSDTSAAKIAAVLPPSASQYKSQFDADSIVKTIQHYADPAMKSPRATDWLHEVIKEVE